MHQRRPLLNDPNTRVTATVNPPLVTLGHAKPALQIEIVSEVLELALSDEQSRNKAEHHRRHRLVNRILGRPDALDLLEASGQLLELRPASLTVPSFGVQGRRDFLDVFDIASDRLVFGSDVVEAAVDATGEPGELLLGEPPFFSSKFRWIDSRTSCKASAIRRPGGWSGPPWSSLTMPRTAAQ